MTDGGQDSAPGGGEVGWPAAPAPGGGRLGWPADTDSTSAPDRAVRAGQQ